MGHIKSMEELSREEQIDVITCQFSGHERMEEVADIFATLTSYKITGDDYVKYYGSLVEEEIKQRINDGILNINSDDEWQEEQNAWNSIIDALGITTIFEIMDNWKKYVGRSIRIENLISNVKKDLYKEFLLEE